ncbi:MAG: hypothetical protein JHC96_15720 [Brevundimonas sp.]|jgi:hypothetical protein|nr:hypothetical protein [Brevundimonas sp.]MBJ7320238.1 hypothetical protein [Brevundimonas sp.]
MTIFAEILIVLHRLAKFLTRKERLLWAHVSGRSDLAIASRVAGRQFGA